MTDPDPAASAAPAPATPATKPEKPGFTFTDAGCRTEVRLGALMVVAAVFMWLWLGPEKSGRLYLVGAPLLLVGIPIQALQARHGRPGYPWKLGLAFTLGALVMWPDLRYREWADGVGSAPPAEWPLHVQTVVPLLLAAGAWIMLWWPIAARNRRAARAEAAA
jgi:hypothetical protein